MSDSLREQMLKAGFKETATNKKKHSNHANKSGKPRGKHSAKTGSNANSKHEQTGPSSLERKNIAEREAALARKKVKAEIKTIIEADKVGQTKGEIAHSYVMGKRIKQMFVSEAIREQLVAGTLVITRLNGSTYLIPTETGERVRALNPDWVVVTPSQEETGADDDYADFQVPDDLTW